MPMQLQEPVYLREKNERNIVVRKKNTGAGKKKKRCYKCGEHFQIAINCPKKDKVCFKCRGSGHISINCTKHQIKSLIVLLHGGEKHKGLMRDNWCMDSGAKHFRQLS